MKPIRVWKVGGYFRWECRHPMYTSGNRPCDTSLPFVFTKPASAGDHARWHLWERHFIGSQPPPWKGDRGYE